MPSSLGGLTLTPVFFDDFDSGAASPGWSAVQGALLTPGHASAHGWDISVGAGGFPLPVIVYDWINNAEPVWGSTFWWQQDVGILADFMRWDATSGGQVVSDINADGSVQFRQVGGPVIVTSAAGVVVNDTWQYHDVRFRWGPTFWELYWNIDGTTVIDYGPIVGTFNGIFRILWSTTGARSWLDTVTISFFRENWGIGPILGV